MRIAVITNSRIPSLTANSIQAMKVCDALTQLGHEIQVIAPEEGPRVRWPDLAAHYGLKHEFAMVWRPSGRLLKRFDFIWHAHRTAKEFKPDLTYTWLPQAAALALNARYPVLLEMHADVGGALGAWWLRRFWRLDGQKRLLVTTRALSAALQRSTGIAFPDDAVRLAPNGVDLERYAGLPKAAEARRLLNLPDCPTAGFTGHFYRGRGMELLHHIARDLPEVNFIWAGGTPDAVSEWRTRLQAARLTNVILTGFVPNTELPRYQAAADVLLMPYANSISSSSGQDIGEVINPMKMFEYMAAERPIVTADLPSIREVLDEQCAVFCRPGDDGDWTVALKALLLDEARRAKLARAARQKVAKYTWLARAEQALEGIL